MEFNPHDYQKYAIEYILTHPITAAILDMGLGKTAITLTAIEELLHNRFEVSRVLVAAPLRVARSTWPEEIKKWDHLSELRYSVVIGTPAERLAALRADAEIYIINRENLVWLMQQDRKYLDFDMAVLDELSSFKANSQRTKAFLKLRPRLKRVVGLTGTPSSNGLMDLSMNSGAWIWVNGWGGLSGSTEPPSSDPTAVTGISCIPIRHSPVRRRKSIAGLVTSRFP